MWAFFGIPLPDLQLRGVIPTAIAPRREGASKGASMVSMIPPSTPATGADLISRPILLLGPLHDFPPIAAFLTLPLKWESPMNFA